MDHTLVHTGQNYDFELNEVFFAELDIRKPDVFLNAAGDNASQTIGNIIKKSDETFEKYNPDALLIYGDTNSCLCVIPAKRRKIPIFHMEAGNRCFDQRVPEEINRKIVDHLSDINLPLSEHARDYLIAEGISADTVFKTGSPMTEVLQKNMNKITQSRILSELKLVRKRFILMSIHREENVDNDKNLGDLLLSINTLAHEFGFPIIVSTHPRTRKKLEDIGFKNTNVLIRFCRPFGFLDYIYLQLNAFCVISDSGTISEEASILHLPAVTIRQAHERPEGMDETTVIMSGLDPSRVVQAVRLAASHSDVESRVIKPVADYEALNVSKKIARLILSYVDFVNRTVWKKA
jgi:UDP-N-acetylglucosamine 2-epimerase (non-hydrolysing)